jgi:hypothetical protein
MNPKKLILTALLSTAMALPVIASDLNQNSDSAPAMQDRDTLQAKSGSTKSSGTCWIYVPGFGWIFIC